MRDLANRQLGIIIFFLVAIISLAIITTSCNTTELLETPTTTSAPDSQVDDKEVLTATPEPPHPTIDNQTLKAESTSVASPEQGTDTSIVGEKTLTPLPKENTITVEQPKYGTFSFSTTKQVVPKDVLEEIAFFTGGGGNSSCQGTYEQPEVVTQKPAENETRLHDKVEIYVCGWQENERIEIHIKSPDGTEITQEQIHPYPSSVAMIFDFKTNILNDLAGQYEFSFSGQSGIVKHSLNLLNPAVHPQLYWNDDDTLLLYNFEPKEAVRVFAYVATAYSSVYKLHAWQTLSIDQNGMLLISPQFSTVIEWYAVIGEFSGQVVPSDPSSPRTFGIYTPSILVTESNTLETNGTKTDVTWPISETGVEACHFTMEELVTVSDNTRLWSAPNVLIGDKILSLNLGQQIEIISSPQWGRIRGDIDFSGWWWEVTTQTDDISGWIWQDRIAECGN